ncbi:MAG: HEAT repeat domain-containing protein [Actinobacteria bacterium]|nr:HEAT repeat domain-containing protein [Actinomycetota bacterium]
MISTHVVVLSVIGEGGALVFAFLVLFLHGAAIRLRRNLLARRIAESRTALIRTVDADDAAGDPPPNAPRLPLREELAILGALRPSITGAGRDRILAIAVGSGLTRRGERLCVSRFWRRRLRGVRLLTLLGCGETCVPPLLDDGRYLVRAQAVEWAAEHPDPALVNRLVELLGHPEIMAPFTVRDALQRIGRPAVGPLVEHLGRASGSSAREPLRVADDLADPRMLGVAVRLSFDADPGARAGSACLLGALGGVDAVETLGRMLEDPDDAVRAAAARALGRSGQWAKGPDLAGRLRDPAWEVRRAAALALRSFGSPGVLLLRRALKDSDGYARDMARQTLDLPETAIR